MVLAWKKSKIKVFNFSSGLRYIQGRPNETSFIYKTLLAYPLFQCRQNFRLACLKVCTRLCYDFKQFRTFVYGYIERGFQFVTDNTCFWNQIINKHGPFSPNTHFWEFLSLFQELFSYHFVFLMIKSYENCLLNILIYHEGRSPNEPGIQTPSFMVIATCFKHSIKKDKVLSKRIMPM